MTPSTLASKFNTRKTPQSQKHPKQRVPLWGNWSAKLNTNCTDWGSLIKLPGPPERPGGPASWYDLLLLKELPISSVVQVCWLGE